MSRVSVLARRALSLRLSQPHRLRSRTRVLRSFSTTVTADPPEAVRVRVHPFEEVGEEGHHQLQGHEQGNDPSRLQVLHEARDQFEGQQLHGQGHQDAEPRSVGDAPRDSVLEPAPTSTSAGARTCCGRHEGPHQGHLDGFARRAAEREDLVVRHGLRGRVVGARCSAGPADVWSDAGRFVLETAAAQRGPWNELGSCSTSRSDTSAAGLTDPGLPRPDRRRPGAARSPARAPGARGHRAHALSQRGDGHADTVGPRIAESASRSTTTARATRPSATCGTSMPARSSLTASSSRESPTTRRTSASSARRSGLRTRSERPSSPRASRRSSSGIASIRSAATLPRAA